MHSLAAGYFIIRRIKEKLIVSGAAIVFLLLAGFVHPFFALISPIAALALFLVNMNKLIPSIKKEEAASSREFWMFIGSLSYFIFSYYHYSTNFFTCLQQSF